VTAGAKSLMPLAAVGGVVLGIAYTLSPLTVLTVPALLGMTWWASRDLEPGERRWLRAVLVVAVTIRVAAVAALFLSARDNHPFATFFGDEEMFKFRSVWLRNIGLGVPISAADFIYAVEETGKSQYLFLLAYLQALVGTAPYGVHLFNMTLYVAAALILYRVVRASFGPVAAFGGLLVLMFLPSLFIWSISALKEPSYTLLAAAELVCVLMIVRAPRWGWRVLAPIGVIAIAFLLEGLRKGGILVAAIGCVGGLAAGFIVTRPRLLLASLVLAPLAVAAAVMTTGIEDRVLGVLRDSAIYHAGHVFTPGYSYKTLDTWYYIDAADITRMPMGDAAAYVVRSLLAFVVQPLPWAIETRTALAYLPEYVVWLTMVALMPMGFIAGVRRDATLACVLAAHGCAIGLMVALTSGNVGTLIRHRGLALPYFVWFAALGACEVVQRLTMPRVRAFRAHRAASTSSL
jgi:hypothetical protein